MEVLCNNIDTSKLYRPPLWAEMLEKISLKRLQHESQQSINDFHPCIWVTLSAMEWCQHIITALAALLAKTLLTISLMSSESNRPQSGKSFDGGSASNTATNYTVLFQD
jgi:hypothetical protein